VSKIVLVLTGIVLLGIAAFATLWFRVGGELQDLAEEVLVDWREGRVDEIWQGGSDALRYDRTPEQFRAYLDYWGERLGPFRKVLRRTNVSTFTDESVTRKGVTLELECEKGRGEGRFDFEVVDETLALRHMTLREARDPVETSDRSALQKEARTLFGYYDDGAIVPLYAAFSPELQWSLRHGTLERQSRALHERVGRITKAELRSEQQPAEDRHVQTFELTFERGTGSGRVEWLWQSNRWDIVVFQVDARE
jgi:hypothetical protein